MWQRPRPTRKQGAQTKDQRAKGRTCNWQHKQGVKRIKDNDGMAKFYTRLPSFDFFYNSFLSKEKFKNKKKLKSF